MQTSMTPTTQPTGRQPDRKPDRRTGMVVLSEDECWERLRGEELGRVAVVVGLSPDVFPVNYRVFEREIAIRTEAGTKLAAGTLMPVIAFEIDGADPTTRQGWSVVVKGRGREPEDLDELMALEELGVVPWSDNPKTRWLLITPSEVTGRMLPGSTPGTASATTSATASAPTPATAATTTPVTTAVTTPAPAVAAPEVDVDTHHLRHHPPATSGLTIDADVPRRLGML